MFRRLVPLLLVGCGSGSSLDAGSPPFSGGLGGSSGVTFPLPEADAGERADAAVPDAGTAPEDAGLASFMNQRFTLPDAGDAGAMTCAWLDGTNCWKEQVDRFSACGPPVGAVGAFSGDGLSCDFDGGVRVAFSSPPPAVADGGSSLWFAALEVRGPDGRACFETAYTLGRARFSSGGRALFTHNTSLLGYQVICPDLRVFDNEQQNGACADFGLRYLQGRVPGHELWCDSQECQVRFFGASDGRRVAARCLRR